MKKWKDLAASPLHCKATYGEAIYQWKFDFWNTANLNMKNGYWGGTKEEFFELYKETWDVFQEVDSRLTIGTPNFSLPDGIDWYEDFLDFCKKESIMPSHLAIHIYSCMDNLNDFHGIFPYPETSYNYLSLTTREFINNLIYFLGRVSKKHGFENLPIIASESGTSRTIFPNPIRDTAFMATYIAHTYIQTISTIDGLKSSRVCQISTISSVHLPFYLMEMKDFLRIRASQNRLITPFRCCINWMRRWWTAMQTPILSPAPPAAFMCWSTTWQNMTSYRRIRF